MTWRMKVRGLVVAVMVLGALAVASGANYTDLVGFLGGWGW